MSKFLVKKFKNIFFEFKIENNHKVVIDKTITNYLIFILAAVGIICVFMNYILVGVGVFAIIFITMNIKSTIYYSIYKSFAKNDQELEEIGSKYSFSDPKTLILNSKRG